MKKTILILVLITCPLINAYCQNSEAEVLKAKSIVFYGYDFSDLKIVDSKRIGQDLKSYFFKLTGFFQEHLPERKLANWIKKDSITYNFNPTLLVNKTITNESIAVATKHTIDKDSVQSMINRYSTTETNGIGYVIIFECFNSYEKKVSAYSVFFDIATKKILLVDYINKHDGNSYNNMKDWSAAAFITIKKLTVLYSDRL